MFATKKFIKIDENRCFFRFRTTTKLFPLDAAMKFLYLKRFFFQSSVLFCFLFFVSIYHILYVILQMRWHQLHLQAPHSAFCAVHWSDDYRCSTIFVSFSFVAESSSLWSRIILDVIFSLSPFVYIMWTNRTRILNIRLWLITLILMLTSDCRLVAFFIMSINSVYLFRLNDEVIVISTIFRFFQTVVKKGNWNR